MSDTPPRDLQLLGLTLQEGNDSTTDKENQINTVLMLAALDS
jgi:hypothetical protein